MSRYLPRFFVILALTALAASLLSAADLSGDWKGAFDFNGTSVPLTFHLKVSETNLSGTIEGLPSTPVDIKDGKIDGATITFNATTDYQGSPVKLLYKGTVADDQIKIVMSTEDGNFSVDFVAKRAS